MKIHKNLFLLSISIICFINYSHSQVVINWKTISTENKHIAGINTGWDYGVIYGLNYGFKVKTKFPLLFSSAISIPSGIEIYDDLKTKIGLQSDLFHYKNFHFSSSLHGIYRQYSNPLVSMKNIGAELSCVIGYYKSKWFVGTEFTFDNAITTHFKHSQLFKDNVYSDVKDGWYAITGGNLLYGLQAGLSIKKSDLTLKIGKVISQDFENTPLIPFYTFLGYNYRF